MNIKIVTFFALFLLLLIESQAFIESAQSTLTPITITSSSPDGVTIYFLDVGQGDSILVKTPSKNILIDGGPASAGSTVVNDLNAYQVAKIDLMVATHPHEDHIGGLISVLQSNIPIQDIVYNGYNYTSTQTFNTWKSLALSHNLTQAVRSQVYSMSPTINFTILSPTSPTQFGSSTSDLNPNSIVMRLQVGNTSVMLTGDAQVDTEQFLVSSGSKLNCQILKVGHHGSSTSTSQAFLSDVTPTFAVISAGVGNPYGHPTQQILTALSSNHITTYGTYTYGTIIFALNPSSLPAPTPTINPTPNLTPSSNPSTAPTANPTSNPTNDPTNAPTRNPTPSPTSSLTQNPTNTPTTSPTGQPAHYPTNNPSPTVPEFTIIAVTAGLIIVSLTTALILKKDKAYRANNKKTLI